jgi:hypothetical protein
MVTVKRVVIRIIHHVHFNVGVLQFAGRSSPINMGDEWNKFNVSGHFVDYHRFGVHLTLTLEQFCYWDLRLNCH